MVQPIEPALTIEGPGRWLLRALDLTSVAGDKVRAERTGPEAVWGALFGAAANGGSCIAHHDGRVVFVRYALPGEQVVARVTQERSSHWHAEVVEVIDPSPDRIESLCPIAGLDGAGCCDLA